MRKKENHTFKQNTITDKYYQDQKNDASYTTKVFPSIQKKIKIKIKKNKNKIIYIHGKYHKNQYKSYGFNFI